MAATSGGVCVTSTPHNWIGGGNIAAILGISPYSTPLAEYHKLRGEAPEPTRALLKFFNRRKKVEAFVVDILKNEYGWQVERQNQRYFDNELTFLAAEIDVEAKAPERCKEAMPFPVYPNVTCNFEIKSVHERAGKPWGYSGDSEAVPVHVAAQALWGLGFTRAPMCIAWGQIGWDDDRVYPITRSDELIGQMRESAIRFWIDRVQAGIPPAAQNAQDVEDWIQADPDGMVVADTALAEIVAAYRNLKAQEKLLKVDLEARQDEIKMALGAATVLVHDGKSVLTWKEQTATRFDQETFKRDQPAVWQQYLKTSVQRTMRLK